MRSLFGKVLLWLGAALLMAFLGFYVVSAWLLTQPPGPDDLSTQLGIFQAEESRLAFERGGAAELAAYYRRLERSLRGRRYLLDGQARDVLTGEDRSALLAEGLKRPLHLFSAAPTINVRPTSDGRFTYLYVGVPRFRSTIFLPFYGWIAVVVLAVGVAFTVTLVRPMRRLRETVARFGAGDLSVRANMTRDDEIGALAGTFDEMAARIESLVTADRRLMQDVSHELRSPLTRMRLAVELAGDAVGDAERDKIERLRHEIARMTDLVDGLLDITRAEHESTSVQRERVDLRGIVATAVEECAIEAAARDCRFSAAAGPSVAVRGDEKLLRRAVDNVLRNAVRHAPAGSQVDVQLGQANGTATLTVRDRGAGVPDDKLRDIFRPFFRVDDDRGRATGGTGLGLAIVRRAVELHRGSVRATNAQPGLAVEIQLPLAE